MKKILIAGGAGFIGSHLCDALINEGHKVICIDNLLTGSQRNIVHLMTRDNFQFEKIDICDKESLKNIQGLDEIYHLASPADPNAHSPYSYLAHPFETMLVNTQGTWNLCELAIKEGSKLSFASTSEIYGDPLVSSQDEDYRGNVSTTGPRSVYDEAKRFGETIVAAFVREKKLDGRITRIFNTYGPSMNKNEGRSVVNLINQAIKNEDMTVYGDGLQTRSFCYISDQIEGQILAMSRQETRGEIFNIGNPQELTILELAKNIKEIAHSKSEIVFSQPLPQDDPKRRKPVIKKAQETLGWIPKIDLEHGLRLTIEYFKNLKD